LIEGISVDFSSSFAQLLDGGLFGSRERRQQQQ